MRPAPAQKLFGDRSILLILGVACAMSACSIRAVTFLPVELDGCASGLACVVNDAGSGTESAADGGTDIVAADSACDVAPEIAADVAPEIAADVAPEARPDTPPDIAQDVVVEAPVDQSTSEAAVDTAGDDGTNDASDASEAGSTTAPEGVCGNGVREGSEECDDGMADSATCNGPAAGSLAGCRFPRCGDGYVNAAAGEQCDTAGDTPACNGPAGGAVGCRFSVCGDGYVNPATDEECDSVSAVDTSSCNRSPAAGPPPIGCKLSRCGDRYLNAAAGEECDSGTVDTDSCNGPAAGAVGCKVPRCGDGYVNAAAQEACDDGNTSDCGTCSADCTTSQRGLDCPPGTPCTSNADCNGICSAGLCVAAD